MELDASSNLIAEIEEISKEKKSQPLPSERSRLQSLSVVVIATYIVIAYYASSRNGHTWQVQSM